MKTLKNEWNTAEAIPNNKENFVNKSYIWSYRSIME